MYKLKLFLLPLALLLAFMALACAPPDDDDRSSGPSGPTINKAIYDFATALLTVQGTDLSPTEAQIQTIKVYGVDFSSYSADAKPTGVNSSGLAKGKYRLHSDGTALWLKLTDQHKATLNGKPGMNNDGLKKGLLTSTGTWAGLNTPKDLDVSNVPDKQLPKQAEDQQSKTETEDKQLPKQAEQAEEQSPKAAITGASYHVGTALLTLQGTHLSATTATQAQIQTITVDGLALNSYTADGTATGADSSGLVKGKYRMKSDGTALWLYLTDQHKATLNGKTGMDSNGLKDGLLTSTGTWAGLDTAKALAVSGNPAPTITSATYYANTGQLYISGIKLPRAVAGWDFSKLTLVSGDGSKRYTLPRHSTAGENTATGSRAGTIYLRMILSGSVKAEAEKILVKGGVRDANGAYNLEAAAGFAGGSAEDTSNNPITVRGYVASITAVNYFASSGQLLIVGVKLPRAVAGWDFSKLTLVSGDGSSNRFTLPRHSTVGANRATGSYASATGLTITLSGNLKAKANAILVKGLVKGGKSDNNGAYNLEAAAGFAGGSAEDLNNAIQVFNFK